MDTLTIINKIPYPGLPKSSSKYGAPMGYNNRVHPGCDDKLYLKKVSIDSGGYDNTGRYFGLGGDSLYHFVSCEEETNGEIQGFIRAINRQSAKESILELMPNVSFFR